MNGHDEMYSMIEIRVSDSPCVVREKTVVCLEMVLIFNLIFNALLNSEERFCKCFNLTERYILKGRTFTF